MIMPNPTAPLDDFDTGANATLPASVILQQWRRLLPVLRGGQVTLREPRLSDAPALMTLLSAEEVGRFIQPPPSTVEGFTHMIERMRDERAAGTSFTLGVVPDGQPAPVGLFQVRRIEPEFGAAEWGFALGRPYWGGGLFFAAAPLVVDFVFDILGARRLEARVSVRNGRGNGALRKLGAVQEALLRQSLFRDGQPLDQVLWTLVADEWRALRRPGNVH
jgi:ribosomal-protein-alanine N-acetyltransferase